MWSVVFAVLLALSASVESRFVFGRPTHGFLRTADEQVAQVDWNCLKAKTCGTDHVTQLVDHFDANNNDTFQQRYQWNFEYYNNTGLVFFMLGGESSISGAGGEKWAFNEDITYITWAKKHGAAIFQAEHRFFGTSRPTPDQSNENIVLLTIEQALADYAHFIEAMNDKYNITNPRWITFGGSYPGSLSAWFRATYPEKTIGAVSTSSAVNVFTDYYGYVVNVGANINDTDSACYATIKDGFNRMERLMYTENGRQQLRDTFTYCAAAIPADMTPKASQNFFQNIYGVFQGINQYTNDNRGVAHFNLTLSEMCNVVHRAAGSLQAIHDVIQWNQNITEAGEDMYCPTYDEMIHDLSNVTYSSPDNDENQEARSWSWLTCTALGYFQTTDGGNDGIFGSTVPADFFVDQCIDAFGEKYNAKYTDNAVLKYRNKYGGAKNYNGTKCVFPNGSYDPWKDLGLLAEDAKPGNEVYALWIEKGAHCSDMYPASDADSKSLTDARAKIEKYVDQFIEESLAPVTVTTTTPKPKSAMSTNLSASLMTLISFLIMSFH